jgi:hypothetical protein
MCVKRFGTFAREKSVWKNMCVTNVENNHLPTDLLNTCNVRATNHVHTHTHNQESLHCGELADSSDLEQSVEHHAILLLSSSMIIDEMNPLIFYVCKGKSNRAHSIQRAKVTIVAGNAFLR